jgi:predicted oxidoreductase (fatty acid repression mutant protein)
VPQKGKKMGIHEALKNRRTYYSINSSLPTAETEVEKLIEETTELVPDAFNMKSSRVVTAFGDAHRKLWDNIEAAFGGKVPKDKIESFRAGAGTVLYFYDEDTVKSLQEKFPRYAENFPLWAMQASGMLQISVWCGLRELNIGASLQHYNPVIDSTVRTQFGLPDSWHLVAQMPFGGISAQPAAKEKEDISKRVSFFH